MNIKISNISFCYDEDLYSQKDELFGSIKLIVTESIEFGEKFKHLNREFSMDMSISIYNLPQEIQQKFIDLYKEVDDYINNTIKRGE